MRAVQIAIALFETEQEAVRRAFCLEIGDDAADVLEAGEHATHLETVLLGNRVDHDRRNDGCNRDLVRYGFGAFIIRNALRDVIEQQDAHLIARDQQVVVAVLHGSAHAVGVGVSCQHEVGVHFFSEFDGELERFARLGVRIRARGEVSVGLRLLGNNRHIGDTNALQNAADTFEAGAIERGVHDFQRIVRSTFARNRASLDGVDEAVDDLFGDPFDATIGERLVEIAHLDAAERINVSDGCGNGICCFGCNLATGVIVSFVAVIRRGVVTGCHVHGAGASQITRAKADCGRRHDAREHVGFHAVGCEHLSCAADELFALVAAVAPDHDGRVLVVCNQVIRKTLGSASNRINVHAVGACTDDAAQAGGTKLEVLVECFDCRLFIVAHGFELFAQIGFLHVVEPRCKQFGFPRHRCSFHSNRRYTL